MKLRPRPGAPAQPGPAPEPVPPFGPGVRATTLLASPGPDRATANRPPKPAARVHQWCSAAVDRGPRA